MAASTHDGLVVICIDVNYCESGGGLMGVSGQNAQHSLTAESPVRGAKLVLK